MCSTSNLRRKAYQHRSTSSGRALVRDPQSQTGLFTPPLGSFATVNLITVPSMMGKGPP